jgi:hypothetical protein
MHMEFVVFIFEAVVVEAKEEEEEEEEEADDEEDDDEEDVDEDEDEEADEEADEEVDEDRRVCVSGSCTWLLLVLWSTEREISSSRVTATCCTEEAAKGSVGEEDAELELEWAWAWAWAWVLSIEFRRETRTGTD